MSSLDRSGHVRNFKRKSFLWTSFEQIEPHFDTISSYLSVWHQKQSIRFAKNKNKLETRAMPSPCGNYYFHFYLKEFTFVNLCQFKFDADISFAEEDDVGKRRPRIFQQCLWMADASRNSESQCEISMHRLLEFRVIRSIRKKIPRKYCSHYLYLFFPCRKQSPNSDDWNMNCWLNKRQRRIEAHQFRFHLLRTIFRFFICFHLICSRKRWAVSSVWTIVIIRRTRPYGIDTAHV